MQSNDYLQEERGASTASEQGSTHSKREGEGESDRATEESENKTSIGGKKEN